MIRLREPARAVATGLAAAGLLLAAAGCVTIPTAPVSPAPADTGAPPPPASTQDPGTQNPGGAQNPPGGAQQSDGGQPPSGGGSGTPVFVASGAVEAWAETMDQECGPPSQGGVAFFATLYSNGSKALTLTIANNDGAEGALLEDHRSGHSYVTTSGVSIDPVKGVAGVDADLQRTDGGATTHVTAVITCP
ncbi:hypothetical protein [Actinocorallia sp. A-T 12471]|uniref:hypothetical protein n=1 Tax=Actinocorallia sp. A-T 12471 TaxID=3089813 RepID=UPI0029CCD4DF|nr:hypothetical protein [Actinocorallia sp. A-T 12471]MDX6739494.1 hypothetical protein [Actinocorallia sp. A-T 12471]